MNILRTKDERRRRAFAYKGNADVAEAILGVVGVDRLMRPNRVMFQFRSSNKRRVA